MRPLFIVCAICCLIAVFNLHISYYTWLRILVSMGALVKIYNLILLKEKRYVGIILFTIILVFFNPITPIYLYKKTIWILLDIIKGTLFLLFALHKNEIISQEKIIKPINIK